LGRIVGDGFSTSATWVPTRPVICSTGARAAVRRLLTAQTIPTANKAKIARTPPIKTQALVLSIALIILE